MTTKTNITYLNCNINEIKLENKDILIILVKKMIYLLKNYLIKM